MFDLIDQYEEYRQTRNDYESAWNNEHQEPTNTGYGKEIDSITRFYADGRTEIVYEREV